LYFLNNVYYLISEKNVWIVDPGDECEKISSVIDDFGYKVSGILLTHGHFDHISSAEKLRVKYNTNVWIHSKDIKVARQANLLRKLANGSGLQDSLKKVELLDDRSKFQSSNVEIYHTPGHTPGSVCIEFGQNLIVGDLLFWGNLGRTDLPGGSLDELHSSIKYILSNFSGFMIWPGHGAPFILNAEMKEQIIDQVYGNKN